MYIENKKIYYWASNDKENNGEGILAINFINLIKKNFEDYSLIPLNKFSKFNQDTFFYKYLLPFWGVLILWKCYFKRQNFSYINFLPAWNIILILVLPPKTIIGPVSGSINRDKFSLPIKLLTKLGIKILSIKYNQIIFSHDLFKKLIKNNKKKYLFNFLRYKLFE